MMVPGELRRNISMRTMLKHIALLICQTTFLVLVALTINAFWDYACPRGFELCLATDKGDPGGGIWPFLLLMLLAAVRPFFLTPLFVVAAMVPGIGLLKGILAVVLGTGLSTVILFFPARVLGARFVSPWLEINLPATLALIRSHDHKVVLASRWIPIFPLDVMTLLFGALQFRFSSVLLATMVGVIPEVAAVALLSSGSGIGTAIVNVGAWVAIAALPPLLTYEYAVRRRGESLWRMLVGMVNEVKLEIMARNGLSYNEEGPSIATSEGVNPWEAAAGEHKKSTTTVMPTVLLLYGFFSSKRVLQKLERNLKAKGLRVISFNLGGMFGVFNTHDIKLVAGDLARNLQTWDRMPGGGGMIDVVAHSKGGLIALWWALKLGGHQRCRRIITMGTPFRGTWISFLALGIPMGVIWRDVWQMRPGSSFLSELRGCEVPSGLWIHNLNSRKDRVAGIQKFEPNSLREGGLVTSEEINTGHFGFLEDDSVANRVHELLTSDPGPTELVKWKS